MAGVGVGGGSPLMRGGGLHGPLGAAGPSADTLRFVASIKVGSGCGPHRKQGHACAWVGWTMHLAHYNG